MTSVKLNSFFAELGKTYKGKPFDGGRIHKNLAPENLKEEDFRALGENVNAEFIYDDAFNCVEVIIGKNIYPAGGRYPRQIRVGISCQLPIERLSVLKLIRLVRIETFGDGNSNQYECHKETKDLEPSSASTNHHSFEDFLLAKDIIANYSSAEDKEKLRMYTIDLAKSIKLRAQERFSKLPF